MTRAKNNKAGRIKANLTYADTQGDGRNSVGGVGKLDSHASYAHALINPFSADSRGVKLPDDDSTRSVPITLKYTENINVTAGGYVGFQVRPTLADPVKKAATFLSTEISTWQTATANPDYAAIAAQFSEYRIVSWGVRVTPLVAPTDQSGFYRLITSPESPASALFHTTGGFYEEVEDFPTANSDVYWVSKPKGSTYKQYIPIADSADWEYLVMFGAGWKASANGAVRIEVVFNIECQMKIGSISGSLATPAADHHPLVLTAVDHSRNKIKNAHKGQSFFSKMTSMAKRGIVSAVSAYGPPLLQGAINALMSKKLQPHQKQIEWVD